MREKIANIATMKKAYYGDVKAVGINFWVVKYLSCMIVSISV